MSVKVSGTVLSFWAAFFGLPRAPLVDSSSKLNCLGSIFVWRKTFRQEQ